MIAGDLDADGLDFLASDPVYFIENVIGERLWSKQCEIAESVRDHKRTCVASAHGTGKTNIAARIGLWWLMTHPYSVVVTTAPTMRQVQKQLWKEVRTAYNRSGCGFGGSLLPKASELQIDGDEWQMVGFSTNDSDAFQGWHSEGGNLFIFDEATGVQPEIWDAVRGCLTSPRDRFLAIGNPTDPTSRFADQFKREDVNTIHISAFDIPNVVEGREVFPGLTGAEWIKEMQEECGPSYETHPDYISRVLGKFPDKDDNALVPLAWLDAAEERWRALNEADEDDELPGGWNTACVLGVDVARGGGAKTIIAEGYVGLGVRALHKEPNQDLMETTGRVLAMGRELGAKDWRIDADGIGSGVADRAAEQEDQRTVRMRGGMASDVVDLDGNKRYLNLRAEWHWTLRERLDPGYPDALALPPDKALRAQLSSIRWGTSSRGLKKIESKEDMLKRGMKSPDESDAVVYAMATPDPNAYDVVDHLVALTSL